MLYNPLFMHENHKGNGDADLRQLFTTHRLDLLTNKFGHIYDSSR